METGVCWWTNSKKRHKSCDLECLLIKYSQQGWFPTSCCIPETYTMLYVNYISRKPRGKFALEGKVLTSGPPGKSHNSAFNTPHWSAFLHILWALASNSAFLCTVLVSCSLPTLPTVFQVPGKNQTFSKLISLLQLCWSLQCLQAMKKKIREE